VQKTLLASATIFLSYIGIKQDLSTCCSRYHTAKRSCQRRFHGTALSIASARPPHIVTTRCKRTIMARRGMLARVWIRQLTIGDNPDCTHARSDSSSNGILQNQRTDFMCILPPFAPRATSYMAPHVIMHPVFLQRSPGADV